MRAAVWRRGTSRGPAPRRSGERAAVRHAWRFSARATLRRVWQAGDAVRVAAQRPGEAAYARRCHAPGGAARVPRYGAHGGPVTRHEWRPDSLEERRA
ncbi:unnamed protein product [Lampetra planeri]